VVVCSHSYSNITSRGTRRLPQTSSWSEWPRVVVCIDKGKKAGDYLPSTPRASDFSSATATIRFPWKWRKHLEPFGKPCERSTSSNLTGSLSLARHRSLTPAGVESAGRCPRCGQLSDGDATIQAGAGWQTWAYCSKDRTRWLIGGGTAPSTLESEGDYAANAAMLEGYEDVTSA
jgi:hypothetical protein